MSGRSSSACQKEACAIQDCLQSNGYNETDVLDLSITFTSVVGNFMLKILKSAPGVAPGLNC